MSSPPAPRYPDHAGQRTDISITTGMVAVSAECRLRFRFYRPLGAWPGTLVVLGHGFLRSKERMVDLARALAETGVATAALDFCHNRWWDGRHYRNGLDMIAVADALGARQVIYMGFSAGGLAALAAARNDPRAIGVVTLDLVDIQGLGVRLAAGMDRPLIGLFGEPSSCNHYNDGIAVYAASPHARTTFIPQAGHCDFEMPTDWLCRVVCQARSGDHPTRWAVQWHILQVATAAVLSLEIP